MNFTLSQLDNEQGFSLGPAAMFVITIVLVIAIALAYVGGVMSGRASAEREFNNLVVQEDVVTVSETKTLNLDEEIKLLAPEELEFAKQLRNGQSTATISDKIRVITAEQPPAKPQENIFETVNNPKASVTEKPKPKNTFDYIYQVAAVKGDENAEALRLRIEGRGLRTYLKRRGKLLLILVKVRGDAKLGAQVVRVLEQLHLGKPILISQKHVNS